MQGIEEKILVGNEDDCYGVIARWYDELYAFRSDIDLQFFLSLADRPGMRILELGCGTGRISIPLARAGHNVTALDLSGAMLDVLRRKLATEDDAVRDKLATVQCGMESFSLGESFDLVLIPFRAFQHLLGTADQRACLQRIREHLAEDGRLVFDLFDPNFATIARYGSGESRFAQDLDHELPDGGRLRRYTRIVTDPGRQLHGVEMRFERLDAGGRIVENGEQCFGMRWMTHNEMLLLLELCGLEPVTVLSGYDGSALEERRGDLIYTCRRMVGH